MYTHDDTRRKNNSNHTLKSVFNTNSHSSLLAAIDKKRSDVSKDKVRTQQMPEQDQFDLKGSAVINFRNAKSNQNGQQQTQKTNKQYYQLKINKKNSVSQHNNGIQINVNIQNMLPHNRKQQLNQAHSDRSLSRKQKDSTKVNKKPKKTEKTLSNTSAIDDFECNEQLEFKVEPKTEKKIIQPLIEKSKVPLIKGKNPEVVDWMRQVKQFEEKVEEIMMLGEAESVIYLDQRLVCYEIDPLYIEKRQKNLNWTMRAILMDWMMHISYEFKLKRQTLYIALTLVDNFFQSTNNLTKADFQLTGAAALFIAAKLEQFEPLSSREFAKSTKERYTAEQIRSMECRIVKTLKYNLNPPTINMWANKLMQQWDLFLESTPLIHEDYFVTHPPKFFKKIDEDSYKNYRTVMQILDCTILDIQTVQYKPKILVCSMLYLILGKQLGEFSKKKIINQFPRTSLFFLDETQFNTIFRMFIEECLGLKMFELLPSVQYLATYFSLPLSYERPCLKGEQQNVEQMHLEQYCSYQTYNPSMLLTVRKRFRGIYQ